jgi:hypothetical protein
MNPAMAQKQRNCAVRARMIYAGNVIGGVSGVNE